MPDSEYTHQDLTINFNVLFVAPIISLVLLVVILRRRSRGEVSVSCWFCNHNLAVPRGNENCFDCPRCDQYNGFSEDGDYNKPIPAQQNEDLNYPVMGAPLFSDYSKRSWNNGLCYQCNHNQAVKIKLLASFQPILLSNEDAELCAYASHLEQLYYLCWRCQERVRRVLEEQDSELALLLPPRKDPPNHQFQEHPAGIHTSWKRRMVLTMVFLVELLSLCCSIFLLLNQSLFTWAAKITASGRALLLQDLADQWSLCFAGLLSTFGASLLNVKKKSKRHAVLGITLWTLLLLWLTIDDEKISAVVHHNSLLVTIRRVRLPFCVALTLSCLASLFNLFTSKHPYPRIRKRILRKNNKQQDTSEKSSSIQNWILSTNIQNSQPSLNDQQEETLLVRGPRLTQAFGKLHITFSKLKGHHSTEQTLGQEFAYESFNQRMQSQLQYNRPILRPAQFLPPSSDCDSVSRSSWVAGGFWALSASTSAEQQLQSRPAFGGVLTPPPSIDGSKNSQLGQTHLETFLSTQTTSKENADTVRRRY